MPFASVNGIHLRYDVAGRAAPRSPPVVFLHGLGSSSADWALQVPVFAERYRVITLDLRAHGESTDSTGRFTVEQMADDVGGLLAQLNEPPAHVVALSLGGCVALALALHHPARVRSLTLVNAFAKYTPVGLRGALRSLRRMWLLWFAPMSSVADFVARGLFPKPEQRPYYEAAVASLSKNRRSTYFASIRAILAFNALDQLHAIRQPTLIVAGDRDQTVPRSAQTALHRAIPGSRLLVAPDSGHATPYDQAELFNRAVLEFIAAY